MLPGAITHHVDVAQLCVALFFLFFAGLVYHLRREDKREGFPMQDVLPGRDLGWPLPPKTKIFPLMDGTFSANPLHRPDEPPPAAAPANRLANPPLVPVGNPLLARLGPGAVGWKRSEPLLTRDNQPQVQPLRVAHEWAVADGDADPRGMTVVGADRVAAGVVVDLWVDRSVKILRYLETRLADGGGHVMVPFYFTDVRRKDGEVRVRALLGAQFADIPRLSQSDIITGREEDEVNAYFAAGYMFARPNRKEPLL